MKAAQAISIGLKGFGMGAANVVPGVSGGTIALLTGIYNEIVDALDSFTNPGTWKALFKGQFKEFWQKIHGGFLLALGVGVVVSVFSLAKLVTLALDYYPALTWAFFFGLIVASSVYMFLDVKGWRLGDFAVVLIGIVMGLVVCTLSPHSTPDDMWFIFVCAAIAICTMILPGISGSFILVILGKYDYIMKAVSELNIPVLVVFALGCAVGILAFAKLLHWLLGRWEKETMLVLMGFVLGSLVKVWPWSDMEAVSEAQILRTGVESAPIDLQVGWAILWALIGAGLVVLLETLNRKKI